MITFNTSSFAKRAAIIIDYDTQEVLFEVNADTLNYPASLTKMMTDPSEIRRLGKTAQETFNQHYTWDVCLQRYLNLYQSMANAR